MSSVIIAQPERIRTHMRCTQSMKVVVQFRKIPYHAQKGKSNIVVKAFPTQRYGVAAILARLRPRLRLQFIQTKWLRIKKIGISSENSRSSRHNP